MTDTVQRDVEDEAAASPHPRRLTLVLWTTIAVAALVLATAGGVLWGRHSSGTTTSVPSASSVDAGFARDMATHHQQAVTMATYAFDNTDNTSVKAVAYDIESSQTEQLGTLTGWLQQWNVSRNTATPMTWMQGHAHMVGPNGLMPGMATGAELTTLLTLHGKALDIRFLQLMIRHHQGGIAMAQYAAEHASKPYVVALAQNMYNTQSAEIVNMEQQLRSLGGTPLPPPAS